MILAHVILMPHAHPDEILGIGVLALTFALVAYAMRYRQGN